MKFSSTPSLRYRFLFVGRVRSLSYRDITSITESGSHTPCSDGRYTFSSSNRSPRTAGTFGATLFGSRPFWRSMISASASFGNGRDGESDPTRVAGQDGRRDATRCVDPHLPPGSRSRPRLVSHWSASSGNRISQVGDAQLVREPLGKLLDQSRIRLRDISGFPFDRRVVVQF